MKGIRVGLNLCSKTVSWADVPINTARIHTQICTLHHTSAWRDFCYRAQDYLELLRIKPTEEDQLKRGWEQITTMFTGESRQILQTLIDNNKITETDQRTPLLALKAIQSAIKNKEHHRNSTTMATKSATTTTKSSKCPWRQFHKHIIEYMDSLHIETCEPQMKIARFMYAVKHNFASTTMDLTKDSKKSIKQLQGSKSITFKIMAQNPSSSTSYSDTDSTYSTEAEINYTEHLPRPPCISKPTKQHLKTHPVPSPRSSKSQQINTKYIQGTRPSHIPIPTKSDSKTSHPNTSTHQPKPSISTWPHTQTTAKQLILPAPKTSTASTYHQRTRKTPLLPTPPSPVRNFNYSSHYKQYITRPSAFNNRNPAFTRPSPSTAPTNSDIEDNQTQLKKCKDRCPMPVPEPLFTFPDYSDTDYPDSNV